MRSRLLLIGALLWMLVPEVTLAQGPGSDAERQSDIRGARQDFRLVDDLGITPALRQNFGLRQLRPGVEPVEEPKHFQLSVALPVSYTTNALGAAGAERDDWHTTPEIGLAWSVESASFKLSAKTSGSIDRFFTESRANAGDVRLQTVATFFRGQWSLNAAYRAASIFAPDFGEQAIALHDLYLGFGWTATRSFGGLDDGLKITAEGRGGQRFTDPRQNESTFGELSVKVSVQPAPGWRVELAPQLKVYSYDRKFQGRSRDDLLALVQGQIKWSPTWLKSGVGQGGIVLGGSFARNASTIGPRCSTEWEVGPSFTWLSEF